MQSKYAFSISLGWVGWFSIALVSDGAELVATAVGLVADLEHLGFDTSILAIGFGVSIEHESRLLGHLLLVEQRQGEIVIIQITVVVVTLVAVVLISGNFFTILHKVKLHFIAWTIIVCRDVGHEVKHLALGHDEGFKRNMFVMGKFKELAVLVIVVACDLLIPELVQVKLQCFNSRVPSTYRLLEFLDLASHGCKLSVECHSNCGCGAGHEGEHGGHTDDFSSD